MLKQHIVCFEHERLCSASESLAAGKSLRKIPAKLFRELFSDLFHPCKTDAAQAEGWLTRDWHGKQAVLKTQHYVGVVQGRCGHTLEILPKTGKVDDAKGDNAAAEMRLMLLRMLQALPNTPFKMLNQQSLIQLAKLPLLTLFVQQALASILHVLQHGLKRDYQTSQQNTAVLRGRLLVQQQLLHNHSNQARFYSQHEDYVVNCPENRVLKLALDCLSKITHSASQQQLIQNYMRQLMCVPQSLDACQDFKLITLDRNTQHYAPALQWAKVIINGFRPAVAFGEQPAFSLLFDMNKLFENSVAQQLRQQLPDHWQLKTQQQGATLLQVNNLPQQKLQPDVLLYNALNQAVAILDTKWKIKIGNTFNQLKPSQQDLYQVFAYAAAYLPHGGNVCLIYPKTAQFSGAVEQAVFHHIRDAEVHLWLLPFCLQDFKLIDAPF